ncbi:MAG: class I SAM-dependent methyltransferase [Bacteroidetes bacterium]|nr:class I SAM-dependent methyltransferase [Bacteroidota bacterium]
MNWEETIIEIRKKEDFKDLVYKSYLGADLRENVERFVKSEEFIETLNLIKKNNPNGIKLLDIGSGNGISAIGFALNGFDVTVVEPDPSETIGAGAIRKLKDVFNLNNIEIHEGFAEEMDFESESFDIVYARQAMHHANNLDQFVGESSRLLKKGGIFLTTRDHVVFDAADKEMFLNEHPLHKFYGGENAFSPTEYKSAITSAGLTIVEELRYFDSPINYYPELTTYQRKNLDQYLDALTEKILTNKFGSIGKIGLLKTLLSKRVGTDKDSFLDEKNRVGRIYSYLSKK